MIMNDSDTDKQVESGIRKQEGGKREEEEGGRSTTHSESEGVNRTTGSDRGQSAAGVQVGRAEAERDM